jgi:hypothetical protein
MSSIPLEAKIVRRAALSTGGSNPRRLDGKHRIPNFEQIARSKRKHQLLYALGPLVAVNSSETLAASDGTRCEDIHSSLDAHDGRSDNGACTVTKGR